MLQTFQTVHRLPHRFGEQDKFNVVFPSTRYCLCVLCVVYIFSKFTLLYVYSHHFIRHYWHIWSRKHFSDISRSIGIELRFCFYESRSKVRMLMIIFTMFFLFDIYFLFRLLPAERYKVKVKRLLCSCAMYIAVKSW